MNNTACEHNIIFECSDLKHDIGLMITTTTKNNDNITTNDNENNNNFQLHLYDGYNDIALVINLGIKDFANMFDSLSEYFHSKEEEGIEL
jgi:hypothetical protein